MHLWCAFVVYGVCDICTQSAPSKNLRKGSHFLKEDSLANAPSLVMQLRRRTFQKRAALQTQPLTEDGLANAPSKKWQPCRRTFEKRTALQTHLLTEDSPAE